jgi:hypothetical protein
VNKDINGILQMALTIHINYQIKQFTNGAYNPYKLPNQA